MGVKKYKIEQKSFFEDIDGNDSKATHLFRKVNDKIIAYSRILSYPDKVTLGRVTVHISHSGDGAGRELVLKSLSYINSHYPKINIHIVAMSYLRSFYHSIGFVTVSDVYDIDGHSHEDMILYKE